MRRLLVCALLGVAASESRAQWVQTNGPLGVSISAFAASSTNLFAATSGGVFLSTDNGMNWTRTGLYIATGALLVLGENLFAGTGGNGVFLSTNNGASWTGVNSGLPPGSARWVHTFATCGGNLFAGTDAGLFVTTNNGTSWTQTTLSYLWVYASAVIGTGVFAGTPSRGVFRSTDNGISWTSVNLGLTDSSVYSLVAIETNLFAGTFSGAVFLSTNNGTHWVAADSGLAIFSVHTFAVSGRYLFAGGWPDGVALSTNSGTSWTPVNTGLTSTSVYALCVFGTSLFAGTYDAGVWRRPLSEMVVVDENSRVLPEHFSLDQNYPNPFNPVTVIGYQVPMRSHVTLKVCDMLGREVGTLVNGVEEPGYKSVQWNACNFTSGVYLCRLDAGHFTYVKKLLLLK